MNTCTACDGPLVPVADDPHDPENLTHPGCAPVDVAAWDRFLTRFAPTAREPLPPGTMRAIWRSICRGCGQRIVPGQLQHLTDVDGHRVWACTPCAQPEEQPR